MRKNEPTSICLPKELKTWLREKADVAYRSITQEIVMRLEESRAREEKKNAESANA